ncbi:MFS transporter [Ciceribacter sp. L1K22]|uniref:MFS transporter n=1 Tax=Ciceribacter sp. L1K22 TaxID=2820275 RepID=UPI001ABE2784|nr:MFS transporter [Ciceribacter sp. L1K22]MBO3761789.1 MFS transporter [Ciceribacter sp. L1K22]
MTRPSRVSLFFYALPAIPLAAMALPFYVIAPTFYAEQLGVSAAGLGVVLLLIRLFDAISDPLVGYMADRVSSAYGRRRAVFLVFAPAAALASFMLFWPPVDAGLGYLALWGLLLSLCYTGVTLPYTAWGAELSTEYAGRTVVSAFREGATLIGTLIAVVLPFVVGVDQAEGLHGLAVLAIVLAIFTPLLAGLAVWKTPEPENLSRRSLGLWEGLQFLGANKAFLRLIGAFFLNGFANAIPATLFLLFVSERLGVAELRGPLLLLYFLCGVIGVPVAVATAARFGKHRSWCGAMTLACVIFAFSGLLQEGDVLAFAVICAATGLLLGFDLTLPPAIQADVIDLDTLRSGEQRTGIYFAAWGLATKLSLALSAGVVFPILEWSGLDPGSSNPQIPTALFALSSLYAWLPILPKLAAIALMWNFPIAIDDQRGLREALENARRQENSAM